MTIKYTKEQLNKFDKDLLIELFLGYAGTDGRIVQANAGLNDRMQLMMEQMVLFQKKPFWQIQRKNGGF